MYKCGNSHSTVPKSRTEMSTGILQVTPTAIRPSLQIHQWRTNVSKDNHRGSPARHATAHRIIFFSQTLTILRFTEIANIPLPLFLICPRLREVILDRVRATHKNYDKYPNNLCSDREAPLLEVLDYRDSHTLVEQMIIPPRRFNTPVSLVKFACFDTGSWWQGRNGLFTTYPQCGL